MVDTSPAHTDEPFVLREDDDAICTLTLNRPRARNPLSLAMLEAFDDHLRAIAEDPRVRVVILTGAGPAFSAGHDLRELHESNDPEFHRQVFTTCSTVMQRVGSLPQPTIARVHGVATAAGCQLVATCDLAVAGESARFATPGVNIGLFCSTPAVAVSRMLAPKHTMELLLTGDLVDAGDAYRMGLVNRVVPDDRVTATAADLAARIAAKSPAVITAGKRAFRRQLDRSVADAYAIATDAMVDGLGKVQAAEGIGAFLDKRAPVWDA